MTYKSDMKWSNGPEIDAEIDRTVFEVQLMDCTWTKTLSIKPRRCYWDSSIIQPFSYAMVATFKGTSLGGSPEIRVAPGLEGIPDRWVSMSAYIMLRLQDKI